MVEGRRPQLKSLAHFLFNLPWKFEFQSYDSFRENILEKIKGLKRN